MSHSPQVRDLILRAGLTMLTEPLPCPPPSGSAWSDPSSFFNDANRDIPLLVSA